MEEIPELGVLVVRTPPEDSIDAKRDLLSDNPNFEYVEKNFIYEANVIPNDQFFNFQDYMGVISAPSAWDTEQGISNTVIAVLDTGVQAIHEDLSGKVLTGCSTLGGFNENNCGPNTDDVHGHGSGVSGTAAAKTNNTVGVAGVCWDCVILPIKVLNDNGFGTSLDIVEGILFARNYAINNPNHRVIINMSLGRDCQASGGATQFEQDAINMAWNNGLLVIAAAGNEGNSNLHCPAEADNTIAVSNTDNNDNLASTSSFGDFVDLAAPGVLIANVFPGNNYVYWSGTSFSSPVVAGVAGLIWSHNSTLTNTEVDQILRDTADNIGSSFFFGDGRVNANAAVIAAGGPPPPTPTPTPTPPPSLNLVLTPLDPGIAGGTSSLTVTGASPGETIKFKYSFNTGSSAISGGICNGQTLDLNSQLNIAMTTADSSGIATLNVPIPLNGSGVTIHMQAYTETGASCGISNRVTQTLDSDPPPVINLVLTPLNPGVAGGTSILQVTGAPPGETVSFKYSFNTGSIVISGGVCNGQTLDLNSQFNIGTAVADGTGTVTLNVPIPLNGSGATVHMQAYAETGASCGTSNRVTQTLE